MSNRKFKAIILDVDGTLVAHHPLAMPTERVCRAVTRAQARGSLVSVATGRLLNGFEVINEHLRLTAPVVLEGGARLYDPVGKKDLWTGVLDKDEAKEIIQEFYRRGLPFGFTAGGALYNSPALIEVKKREIEAQPEYAEGLSAHRVADRIILTDVVLEQIPYDAVTHLISYPLHRSEAESLHDYLHTFSDINATINTTHYQEGWCIYLTHVLATKQHGIVEFAKHHGISTREIIGVGDQEIDYPLLMACGFKVAMGNAVQSLKDIADYVAPSVEEDGAAEVIERFLLSSSSPT